MCSDGVPSPIFSAVVEPVMPEVFADDLYAIEARRGNRGHNNATKQHLDNVFTGNYPVWRNPESIIVQCLPKPSPVS